MATPSFISARVFVFFCIFAERLTKIIITSMKKVAFFISVCLVMALSSCMPKMSHDVYYIDYEFAGKGKVFITESNSVSFDYEPLGSIVVVEKPGEIETKVDMQTQTKTVRTFANASTQSALNYAVDKVIELGGNGLVNLKFEVFKGDGGMNVMVSGMAIRRK